MTMEQAREQLAKAEAARSASRADHAAAQRALLDANGLLQDAKEAQERAEEAQERALDYRLLADAEVLDAERGVEVAAARAQQADANAVLAARKLDELVREARAEQWARLSKSPPPGWMYVPAGYVGMDGAAGFIVGGEVGSECEGGRADGYLLFVHADGTMVISRDYVRDSPDSVWEHRHMRYSPVPPVVRDYLDGLLQSGPQNHAHHWKAIE